MVFADLSRWVVLTLSLLPCEKVVDSPCLSRVELEFLSRKLSRLLRILSEIPPSLRCGRQSGMGVSLGSWKEVLMAVNSRWLKDLRTLMDRFSQSTSVP